MNKFTKMIGGSDETIKSQRAKIRGEAAAAAAQSLVDAILQEKRELDTKILNLVDLSPDTTESLQPTPKDWDAKKWVKELHEARLQRILVDLRLKDAKDIQTEWFSEDETKPV